MENKKINVEDALWAVIILLAFGLRLIALDHLPLGEYESSWALQAWHIANGTPDILLDQPGYVLFTSFGFFLLNASNWLARLVPGIMGSLLIFVPFLLREKLGRKEALLVGLFLALDPFQVSAARTAGGSSWAVASLMLAAAFVYLKKPVAAGIFSGLCLLGGSWVWPGLLGLGLAFLWKWFSTKREVTEITTAQPFETRKYLITVGITLVSAGTLLAFVPQGLSAAAQSVVQYFQQWGHVSNEPLLQGLQVLFTSLITYSPLVVVFGLIGLFSRLFKNQSPDRFFCFWWLAAMILVLIYPDQNPDQLVWTTLPLAVLAARQILRMVPDFSTMAAVKVGFSLLLIVLVVFAFLSFYWLLQNVFPGTAEEQLRTVGMVGAIALIILVSACLAWGWGWSCLWSGWYLAVVALLGLTSIAMSWRSAGLGTYPEAEMLRSDAYFTDSDLLSETIDTISTMVLGNPDSLDIVVIGLDDPSIEWLLRTRFNVVFTDQMGVVSEPPIMIVPEDTQVASVSGYRGQDFILRSQPVWSLLTFPEWVNWIVRRIAPDQSEYLILFARNDLFPLSEPITTTETP